MPFPPPGDLPKPGKEPQTPVSPALAGGFFTTAPRVHAQILLYHHTCTLKRHLLWSTWVTLMAEQNENSGRGREGQSFRRESALHRFTLPLGRKQRPASNRELSLGPLEAAAAAAAAGEREGGRRQRRRRHPGARAEAARTIAGAVYFLAAAVAGTAAAGSVSPGLRVGV